MFVYKIVVGVFMLDLEVIKLELKKKLSSYRFEHSLRVADVSKELARLNGVDENEAYIAGLLHDIAKEFSDEENEIWILKYGLDSNLLDDSNKKVVHSYVGELVVRELYNVSDNVCQAIRFHTLGNIRMNTLDKIVFIADKIESGKNYFGIDEERDLAYKDLDKCLVLCLKNNREKLIREGKKFHDDSLALLNFLLSR